MRKRRHKQPKSGKQPFTAKSPRTPRRGEPWIAKPKRADLATKHTKASRNSARPGKVAKTGSKGAVVKEKPLPRRTPISQLATDSCRAWQRRDNSGVFYRSGRRWAQRKQAHCSQWYLSHFPICTHSLRSKPAVYLPHSPALSTQDFLVTSLSLTGNDCWTQ